MRSRAALLLALLLPMAGCVGDGPGHGAADDVAADPLPFPATSLVGDDFSFAIHRALGGDTNAFHSPFSMRVALAMLAEGARGETQAEILSAIGFASLEDARAWARSAVAAMAAATVRLETANSVWPSASMVIEKPFTATLADAYDALVQALDYGDPEAARAIINGWVEEQTEGRIEDLFAEGSIRRETVVALVNAITFKGDWATPFDADLTKDGTFDAPSGDVEVPMMRLPRSEYGRVNETGYYEEDDLQVLEMPYEGGDVSMVVFLPADLQAFEAGLDRVEVDRLVGHTVRQAVDITFPRFEMTTDYDLIAPLRALGIEKVFDPRQADLSGIVVDAELAVNAAIHKAFVKVDEEGTEAAAATGIGIVATSLPPPPPSFVADHPFLFVIRENTTGELLFMGRIVDPS